MRRQGSLPGRVWDGFLDVLLGAGAILTLLMMVGISSDVVLRMSGMGSLGWVFDLAEYGMLGLLALGTATVLRDGRHVNVDLVVSALPPRAARWPRLLGRVVCLAISATLAWAGTVAAHRSWEDGSLIFRFIVIPEWLPFAAVALLFTLLTVECLRQVVRALVEGGGDGPGRSDMF